MKNFIEKVCDKIEDFAYDHTGLYLVLCYVVGLLLGISIMAAAIPLYKLFDKIFGTHLYEKYFG